MHDRHDTTSCDDAPDRVGAWLRLLAADARTALSWRWLQHLAMVALMFASNVVARLMHGRTAVLRPSRSGGADHGLRATLSSRNPMIFGGAVHARDSCRMLDTQYLPAASVRYHGGRFGWVAMRRTLVGCFTLHWPADHEGSGAK